MNQESKGMTLIVKTVTKLTLGFILLYGIYIALSGHISPGGGFAGGVIIALSFVHIMLAFGKEVALKRLHSHVLRFIIGAGALVFLCIVMLLAGGPDNPLRHIVDTVRSWNIIKNEMVLPVCEMAIVGSGLFAVFVALVLLSKTDRDAE